MRLCRKFPLILLPFLVGCAKWQDYTAPDGSFKCRLPGKVKVKSQTQDTPGGTITIHTHLASAGKTEFGVAYVEFPPGTPYNMDVGIDASVRGVSGKLVSKKPCTIEGVKGVEFECDATSPKTTQVVSRMFVYKNRAYQLMAIGPKFRAGDKQVQDFFDSFKLLHK
jgi:hypothetical protein